MSVRSTFGTLPLTETSRGTSIPITETATLSISMAITPLPRSLERRQVKKADGGPIIARKGAATSFLGLSITYNVGDSMYADYIQMAGVRVVIHGQNEPVFPDVMGIDAPSGYQTAVAMRKVKEVLAEVEAGSGIYLDL